MDRIERAASLSGAGIIPPWVLPTLVDLGWSKPSTVPVEQVLERLHDNPIGRQLLHKLSSTTDATVGRLAAAAVASLDQGEVAQARNDILGRFYALMGHAYANGHCRACAALDSALLWSRLGDRVPFEALSEPDKDARRPLLSDETLQGYIKQLNCAVDALEAHRASAFTEANKSSEPVLRQALINIMLERFGL